jgi:hypothetical protein
MPPKKTPKRRATASPPTSEPADDADVALVPYAAPNTTTTPSNDNKLPDLTEFDDAALTALLHSSVPNVPQVVERINNQINMQFNKTMIEGMNNVAIAQTNLTRSGEAFKRLKGGTVITHVMRCPGINNPGGKQ